MDIGIPRELRSEEYRVALSPPAVRVLVEDGHRVYVEAGAGEGARFRDRDYDAAGATIVHDHAEVYGRSQMVAKVLPPTEAEVELLQSGQVLAGFLHLAAAPPAIRDRLRALPVTPLAYERIRTPGGPAPILAAMSEIAGNVAVHLGAVQLASPAGGRGILLGGASTVAAGRVVVVGAGVAGWAAARTAAGLGADVTLLDVDSTRLREAHFLLGGGVKTAYAHGFALERALGAANLVVLAVSDGSGCAPRILPRAGLQTMKAGAVLVDLSITEGGAAETSRPTRLSDPAYTVDGIVHVAVPNLPSSVARTATRALSHVALPYLRLVAELGVEAAAGACPELFAAGDTPTVPDEARPGRALPPGGTPGWWRRAGTPPVAPPGWWGDPT